MVSSEGFVGDGRPTDDRVPAKEVIEKITMFRTEIEESCPAAWTWIAVLIDKYQELESQGPLTVSPPTVKTKPKLEMVDTSEFTLLAFEHAVTELGAFIKSGNCPDSFRIICQITELLARQKLGELKDAQT